MNYGIVDVCNRMLDNADMRLDLSEYPTIIFKFIVHGLVDEKYWEVEFQCDKTIHLKIDNDDETSLTDLNLVLETSVTGRSVKDIDEELKFNIGGTDKEQIIWFISVYGDVLVEVVCEEFNWNLNELSETAYNSRYTQIRK